MALISWGKPALKKAPSTAGVPGETWTAIDTPKADTTKLTATAGAEKTAVEEGGEIVDVRYEKSTFELEFDIFVKKGGTKPFEDQDGLVSGEWAFRIIPEDPSCEGIQIDRAIVRCETNYTSAEGIILHYVAKCIKPASGNTIKPYTGE